jgi:two-component system sensor histidine kinase AtoS
MTPPGLLSMRAIRVSYGRTMALHGVDFDLESGEIHALVGAHRAGKSTLVKLLSGAVRKQSGEITFQGRRVDAFTPKTAIRSGIGIVYQHLNVIPSLSAAENVFAGRLVRAWPLGLSHRRMREQARALFERLSFPIDVDVPVSRLTVAAQHMVELARVLSFDPRVLILDEVSNKLTPEEMERIYPVLASFREQGRSVIYITHNMDEIFQFADRVTILKDGRRMDTERIADLDRIKLIKLTYSFVLSREELGRQNLELLNLKRYNENIIRNIPVGVVILNAEQRVHLANRAAAKILGPGPDEPGRLFEDMIRGAVFPDRSLVLAKIESREELHLEAAAYGESRTLKISVFPFRDEDYVFLGTILLLEDVTRDRAMDDYLMRAEKMASTAELAAGVAHEINNPLGIVQNYIELLKLKDLEPDARLKLTKIEREVNRIEKTVGSLLSFSRFDEVTSREVDLAQVLEEVIVLLEHRFSEKSVSVTANVEGRPALVLGDENKLKQLLVNLMVNSVEALPDRDGRIEAALTVKAGSPSVAVSITDNGSGIADEVRGRIFDPFFSTKQSRRNAGLGLSVSQRIVELHGGVLTCECQQGCPTRFTVTIPRARRG